MSRCVLGAPYGVEPVDDPTLIQEVGLAKHNAVETRRELGEAFNAFVRDKDADKFWHGIKAAATRMPALAQFDAVRQWLEKPVLSSDADATPEVLPTSRPAPRSKPKRKKVYKTPQGRPVQAAYSQPRHGRSSLLAGLLRGPWG